MSKYIFSQYFIFNFEFLINPAGSSNGRTTPFGGVCRGSNPLPAAEDFPANFIK